MNRYPIKCNYCGKFIKYSDIENGDAKFIFVPDSEVSSEVIEHICKNCNKD
jgi:hypothetical protein